MTALPLKNRAPAELQPDAETRHRVLLRCGLRCEQCGAEDGRSIWRTIFGEPLIWLAHTPGVEPLPGLWAFVKTVKVFVVPRRLEDWNGTEDDLIALCFSCWCQQEIELFRVYHLRHPLPVRAKKRVAV